MLIFSTNYGTKEDVVTKKFSYVKVWEQNFLHAVQYKW